MKAFTKLLIVAAIGAAAYFTCPDRQAHSDAIKAAIEKSIANEINPDGSSTWLSEKASKLGSSVAGWVFDKSLVVKNYYVLSLGEIDRGDGPETVSIGAFGHVFCFLGKVEEE